MTRSGSQIRQEFIDFFIIEGTHFCSLRFAGSGGRPNPAFHQRGDGAIQGCIPGHRPQTVYQSGKFSKMHAGGWET